MWLVRWRNTAGIWQIQWWKGQRQSIGTSIAEYVDLLLCMCFRMWFVCDFELDLRVCACLMWFVCVFVCMCVILPAISLSVCVCDSVSHVLCDLCMLFVSECAWFCLWYVRVCVCVFVLWLFGGSLQIKVEKKVGSGDAKDVICVAVDKLGADILVIGSHEYGFFKRYLFYLNAPAISINLV